MKQSHIFTETEGNAWYERNIFKKDLCKDPVIEVIKTCGLYPHSVLEYGCCDGTRLKEIRDTYNCWATGADPSNEATLDGRIKTSLPLYQKTADERVSSTQTFDLIIYGFCLYVCDPHDYFKIVHVGDDQLYPSGHIIIHDFLPDYPHSRSYAHDERITTRKMDFSRLWLANPNYRLVHQDRLADGTGISVIKKAMDGFPLAVNDK